MTTSHPQQSTSPSNEGSPLVNQHDTAPVRSRRIPCWNCCDMMARRRYWNGFETQDQINELIVVCDTVHENTEITQCYSCFSSRRRCFPVRGVSLVATAFKLKRAYINYVQSVRHNLGASRWYKNRYRVARRNWRRSRDRAATRGQPRLFCLKRAPFVAGEQTNHEGLVNIPESFYMVPPPVDPVRSAESVIGEDEDQDTRDLAEGIV
ncbi:hypothetical protein F4805DRAFT_463655 [Annulohypoxylon moriforme]|nr:hypothetical protein F4805DRAFT_463655 [Annulohypoxylon moriforme]